MVGGVIEGKESGVVNEELGDKKGGEFGIKRKILRKKREPSRRRDKEGNTVGVEVRLSRYLYDKLGDLGMMRGGLTVQRTIRYILGEYFYRLCGPVPVVVDGQGVVQPEVRRKSVLGLEI